MRTAVLGVLVCAGLSVAAVLLLSGGNESFAQRAGDYRPVRTDDGLIALSTVVDNQYQQVTLIDPDRQVMSVYHVQLATGSVKLRCVRNFHWDLEMLQHNGESPLPREIQSLLEPR
jgi:hypothetical protein